MTPKTGERRFDRSYAVVLIKIAKQDLYAAKSLAKNSKVRRETAIFLAQQCIEKSLKAVLCNFSVPVPLVHDLGALVAKMPNSIEPPHGYALTSFNDYAGILRYETGSEKLSVKDVRQALLIAGQVHNWAIQIIKDSKAL